MFIPRPLCSNPAPAVPSNAQFSGVAEKCNHWSADQCKISL
jgi:hypothetical protein